MGIILKVIQALAAALPALISWWERRQAAKAQAEAQARADAVRADPGAEWMRKFNAQANPGGAPNQAGVDQPGDHK